MAFPQTPLPIQVDLMVDGAWSAITGDVYQRDAIRITRGRTAEGQQVDPGRCSLTLNNRDGRYSPRNPLSPLYEKIGRNTPIRVSVHAGAPYLELTGGTDRATTPDAATLDITGDIDVRIEVSLADWRPSTGAELVGKYDSSASNQRSWLMLVGSNGELAFRWSTDGTGATVLQFGSTEPIPVPSSGRIALRSTLNVSSAVVTHYTAPSIAGPWTQLGAPGASGPATTVFASTAPLEVGDTSLPLDGLTGSVYAVEVRNGISGTVVAAPDFTAQTVGASSFVDSAGRTWSLNAAASISNRVTRFTGEVPSWPVKWDGSGNDIYVTIEAAGILRRLGQGAAALDSTLRRRIPTAANVLAYWPMEEGSDAVRAYSPIVGVPPLTLSNVNWASVDTLPSSNALPVLASSNGDLPMMSGTVPAPTGATTGWHVRWIYRLDTPNTTLYTWMRILTTGTVRQWYIQARDTQSRVLGLDVDGVAVVDQLISTGSYLFNQWNSLSFRTSQSGGTVTWTITWQTIGGTALQIALTYAGTAGTVRGVASPPDGYAAALDGMAIGHLAVFSTELTSAYDGCITAYAGESAGTRMLRLAEEEGVPVGVQGVVAEEELLGPQRPDTLVALLQEAAETDHGILCEARDSVALAYRDRGTLYNQTPTQLTYSTDLMPPLEPIDDDQLTRNDITVQRINGSYGRAVLESGPLSVNAPPAGVGVYSDSVSLSLRSDDQAEPHAGWLMHLGTTDEPRYPVVNISLQANPELIETVAALDSGSRLQILDPPAKLPPGAIDLLVQGYSETLWQKVWDVQLNCTPASPYTVGVTNDPLLARADTDGSQLTAAVTATATTLMVDTPIPWTTDPSDMPMDVRLGGEVVAVTAISGLVQDAFARTVATGWGTADSGQAWTTSGGTTSDFYVQGA